MMDDEIDDAMKQRDFGASDAVALARAREFIRRRGFAEHHHHARSLREPLAALAAVVTAIAVSVVIVAGHMSIGPHSSTPPARPSPPPGSAAALATDAWTQLPPAPIAGRGMAAVVWDGREMLVWGGGQGPQMAPLLDDGASYDPATRTWAVLPPSPLGPRDDTASVWTGRDFFIWGGYISDTGDRWASDGALYDPRSASWRLLPRSPLPAQAAQAVWTGSEVIVMEGPTQIAAYVPATDKWHSLPSMPPTPGDVAELEPVVAGSTVYVWEPWTHAVFANPNASSTTSGLQLVAFDESSNLWTTVDTSGDGPHVQVPGAFWTGTDIVTSPVSQHELVSQGPPMPAQSYRWSPSTRAWSAIPPGPVDDLYPSSLWTGSALLDYDAGGKGLAAVWDPGTNAWTRLPAAPYEWRDLTGMWTGHSLLVWGEMAPPRTDSSVAEGPWQAIGLQFGPPAAPPNISATLVLPTTAVRAGAEIPGQVVVDNGTGHEIRITGCGAVFQVLLMSGSYHPLPLWLTCLTTFTIPKGRSVYPIMISAFTGCAAVDATRTLPTCPPQGSPPLPPGTYDATPFEDGNEIPLPAPVTVTVTP